MLGSIIDGDVQNLVPLRGLTCSIEGFCFIFILSVHNLDKWIHLSKHFGVSCQDGLLHVDV